MIQVKWAHPDNLRQWENSIDSVPVIELSELTEVVEGLRDISQCGECEICQEFSQRLLAQLWDCK